nr:reverse transcriptase domain-containing protein [Tanacetum cinerariifolium]
MKLIENYQMYVAVFRVDVPTTQLQLIESTQGTHRTTSAPRSPNLDVDEGESSAQRKSTVIRLCIPPRRSSRLTSPIPISTTPILTAAEVEDITLRDTIQLRIAEQKNITLRDTIQLRIAEQKSHDYHEAQQNLEKVNEHLVAEEIEKMVEGTKSKDAEEVDNSILNSQNNPCTRLDHKSYKESLKVNIPVVVQPVNVIKEEEESAEEDYELKRRLNGMDVEETRNTPPPTPIRSPRIHSTLISLDNEKLKEVTMIVSRNLLRHKFQYVAGGLIMERKQNQADVAQMIADAIQQECENLWAKTSSQINNAITNHILLRQCPHHGFSELHQLDTFYNALNPNDQDALDSAAGGN